MDCEIDVVEMGCEIVVVAFVELLVDNLVGADCGMCVVVGDYEIVVDADLIQRLVAVVGLVHNVAIVVVVEVAGWAEAPASSRTDHDLVLVLQMGRSRSRSCQMRNPVAETCLGFCLRWTHHVERTGAWCVCGCRQSRAAARCAR